MSPTDFFDMRYSWITANQALIAAKKLQMAMNPDLRITVRIEDDPSRWNKVFIVDLTSWGMWSNIAFEYHPKFWDFEHFLQYVYETLRRVVDDSMARNIIDCMINLSRWWSVSWITPMPDNIANRIKNEAEERCKDEANKKIYFFFIFVLAIPHIPEEILSALELSEEAQQIQKSSFEEIAEHKKKIREHYQKYWTLFEKIANFIK